MQNITQPTFTLDVNDTWVLKTGQVDRGLPSRRSIKFTPVGGYDGSITLASRSRGSAGAFTAQPFEKEYLNGAAADGSKVAGSTVINSDSTILIDDSSLELALVSSNRTVGSMTVDTRTSTY